MVQQTKFFPLTGGLDLVTPDIAKPPGRVIDALNYEPDAQGYKRVTGYERFDGQPAPSDTRLWRINYTDNAGDEPVIGDYIKDSISSPSSAHRKGRVVAVVVTTGSWAGNNATGYIVATNMTYDFTGAIGHFNTSPSPTNNFTCSTQVADYDFGAQQAAYMALAVALNRNTITAVPGSGPVRGVWVAFDGNIIAMRDNAGATAGTMWKSSTAGWTQLATLTRIDFTSDTATQVLPVAKSPSNTVANASSSTSDGTIRSVAITDTVGTVNTGYMLVSGYVAGSFTAGGQTIYIAGSSTVQGTTSAAATTFTISAGGRYFFVNHNFYGAEDRGATYMVNGVGQAIIYDSNGFATIPTGMDVDTPTRIAVHRDSLFLSFPGGSLQYSSPGEPLVWDPILGAGEIGMGDEIVNLIPASGSTLAILCENSVAVLYGYDATDFQLEVLSRDAGALAFSVQRIGEIIYLDNIGIRKLSTTAAFGDFQLGAMSRLITPLLESLHGAGTVPIVSFPLRHRDQYWLIFDDGTGIVGQFAKKDPEFLPVDLGLSMSCACNGMDSDSDETIFFGDDQGFVYELDKGTSFDGGVIPHHISFAFNHFGAPDVVKRVHRVLVDLQTSGTVTISAAVGLDNGSVTDIPSRTLTVVAGGMAYYGSQIPSEADSYMDGVGRNMSLKLSGSSSDEAPHTLTGVTFFITPLELKR